jgi:hypothetical protein
MSKLNNLVKKQAVRRRLVKIFGMAQQIKTQEQLDAYMGQISDPFVRRDVLKLITPVLRFKVEQE